jgi:tetratricopeptide (TPR) repeat protein
MFTKRRFLTFALVSGLALFITDEQTWGQERSSYNIQQGLMALQQESYNKALEFFYRDTSRATAGDAWFYIGQTYFKVKQYNDALDGYDNALRHLKCDNDVITAIWRVFSEAFDAGRADVNVAIEKFNRLLIKCPNSVEVSYYLALSYQKGAFFNRARKALYDAINKLEEAEKSTYSVSQFYNTLNEVCQLDGGGIGTAGGLDLAIEVIAPLSKKYGRPRGKIKESLASINTVAILYYQRAKVYQDEQEKYLKHDPNYERCGKQHHRYLALADSVYEIVIKIDRPNINHYLSAADVAEDLGFYDKALRYYRDAETLIQKDSKEMITIKFNLGKTLVQLKEYTDALKNLNEAERLNRLYGREQQSAFYYWMAEAYLGRAKSPQKYSDDEDQGELYLRFCNNSFSRILTSPDIGVKLAEIYSQRGNYKEAVKALESAKNSQEALGLPVGDLQFRLGRVLINEKDYPRAVVYLTDALKVGVDSLSCLFNLGVAQRYLNQPQLSLASLELAQELAKRAKADSMLIAIKATKGAVLIAQGDRIKEAVEFLEDAVKEMPNVVEFKLDLAKAYLRSSDNEKNEYFDDAENLIFPLAHSSMQPRPVREQAQSLLGQLKKAQAVSLINQKSYAQANPLLEQAAKAFEEAYKFSSNANSKHMDDFAEAKRMQGEIASDVAREQIATNARNRILAFVFGILTAFVIAAGGSFAIWKYVLTKKIDGLRVRTNTVAAKAHVLSGKLELLLKELIKIKAQKELGEPWYEKLWDNLGNKDWKIIHDWQVARGLKPPDAEILDHANFSHLRDIIAAHEPEWFEPIFQDRFDDFKKLLSEIKSLRETTVAEARADAKIKNRLRKIEADIDYFLGEINKYLQTWNINQPNSNPAFTAA